MVLIGHKDARIWPIWHYALSEWPMHRDLWYYISKGFTKFVKRFVGLYCELLVDFELRYDEVVYESG